ncbi:MAG: homoserine dehydrogenase [Opitutus sp.]|nr:homoserine dehydrogenase [Opitutus sp.]MCS6247496.1 homoserine dehydrogenase [Opitutus sp.]MCS6273876.1 homoserine dehydrogenase [Opitutus sp.]MCS6278238.1 homoserine dehydrogenase [Opitutus sp.]MCS6299348.1 homoserine dehydrogenase [Opitutus sp.]
MSVPSINIGICGLGTVGQGVWKHIEANRAALESRLGVTLNLARASVRDLKKKRTVRVAATKLTLDPLSIATDPAIHIVCELIGGTTLAREITLAALKSGKTVVSANKALLCKHGPELFAAARKHGGHFLFEASVAGGIPIIKALREGLVANRFKLIYGILNGTCNYILTRMEREGLPYPQILAEAKALGYAEADESLDVEGWDTAHKASILAFLAHGIWVPTEKMLVEGITHITQTDLAYARENGFAIKLLAIISCEADTGEVFVRVHPTLIPRTKVLANVNEVYNGISVTGDVVGETVYIGRGAGQDPTASAVISDIVDAVILLKRGNGQLPAPVETHATLTPLQSITGSYYLRLEVKDEPGVLAKIASATATLDVSIASVLQRPSETAGAASLILTTHQSNEKAIRATVARLKKLSCVVSEPVLLRIADFAA